MLTSKEPLNRYEGFRATNLDDLCSVVESNLHARLVMASRNSPVDAFANSCALPASHLWFCSYGSPLTLQFGDGDYIRVQFAHSGSGRTFIGKNAIPVTATQSCVSPASATIEFPEGFQQLVWRVERNVLTNKLTALLGMPVGRTLEFNGVLELDKKYVNGMPSILNCILLHLSQASAATSLLVIRELEQALIVSLLCQGDHNYRVPLSAASPNPAPRQVRRVEEYLDANWANPVCIEDIASIAGVSARSIYRAFRASRGYSPMAFVKRRRLMRANELLSSPASVLTVTQVAFACGFSDVSRFSKDFTKAYGVAPSSVRVRSKHR